MNIFKKIIKDWNDAWNESKKKDLELKHQTEKENEQAKRDEEDAIFFKTNVANFEIFEKNGGKLPIRGWQAGKIILNDKNKTAKIEIRQTGDRDIEENGAWYHVPYYGLGHILCENVEYKKITTDINGGVFLLFQDKNNPNKIKIMLNHNRQGIEIVCDKVSMIDFEDVNIEIDDFKDIDIGCKIGKYFEITNE